MGAFGACVDALQRKGFMEPLRWRRRGDAETRTWTAVHQWFFQGWVPGVLRQVFLVDGRLMKRTHLMSLKPGCICLYLLFIMIYIMFIHQYLSNIMCVYKVLCEVRVGTSTPYAINT